MGRMVRGIDSTYEELFAYACPKFITAAPPNLDAPSSNTNQVASAPGIPHLAGQSKAQLSCSLDQHEAHMLGMPDLSDICLVYSLARNSQAQVVVLNMASPCC